MAPEQEQEARSFAPTDESAMAWIQGSDQKAEQPGAQAPVAPSPTEQAPAPSAPTASPDLAAQIREILKAELNPLQSEVGQLRKVRSEFDKFRQAQNQPQTPASLSQMPPEQQAAVSELIEHFWNRKYGKDWERITETQKKWESELATNAVASTVRELAGDKWAELDPIMGRIYEELGAKADAGDEKSRHLMWEIANTHSGAAYIVQLAKQELSQTVQATEQKATGQRQAQAKKAGTALSATPPATGAEGLEALKKLPTEKLKQYLIEHGGL